MPITPTQPDQTVDPELIKSWFGRLELDPDTVNETLGAPYDRVTPDSLLAASAKTLKINRGEADTDDRDSLEFQIVYDTSDFLRDKIRMDQNRVLRSLLWKVTGRQGELDRVPSGIFDAHADHLFRETGMAQAIEELNPVETVDQNQKITRMGEGALPNLDAVPAEARNVQPSYLGYIDPVRSPERMRVGVDLVLARNVKKGPDNLLYRQFVNQKTGKPEWVSSQQAARSIVAFAEDLATGDQYVPVLYRSKGVRYVPRGEVELALPHGDEMFSLAGSLVPILPGVKGMRYLMGCLRGSERILIRRETRILDLAIQDYTWQAGDETLSLNEQTLKTEWASVRGLHINQNQQEMLTITLKSGRTLCTTANHRWVTLGDAGELLQIEARDLKLGQAVPRVGELRGLTERPVLDHAGVQWPATFDFGWLCGLYLAEGSISQHGTAVFWAGIRPHIIDRVSAIGKALGARARTGKAKKYPTGSGVYLYKAELKTFILAVFGKGSAQKHIDGVLLSTPSEFRRGILAGYLAGDGTVCLRKRDQYARVLGGTRSQRLSQGLVQIALSLGIDSSLVSLNVTGTPFYHFELKAGDIDKLGSIQHVEKDALLQKARKRTGKKSGRWIPMYQDLRRRILSVSKRTDRFRARMYTDQHTKQTLEQRLTPTECRWLSADVIWDTIVKIEWSAPDAVTYDLDVNDRVFMTTNGILVHNSKYSRAALPLVGREAPLVQPADQEGKPIAERFAGQLGVIRAEQPGTVLSVKPDEIVVQQADGTKKSYELVNLFPHARKTYRHNYPEVKEGDTVKPGQLLATSNYTTKDGQAALGTNLRIMFSPAYGNTFEDSIVISESAAKKLTSEHMYNEEVARDDDVRYDLKAFSEMFPGKFDARQVATLDENGRVKPGTVLKYGDPVFVGVRDVQAGPATMGRKKARPEIITWEHDLPGVVTDVADTKDGMIAYIRSNNPMQVGDKIGVPWGGKGVVSEIVPDDAMWRDEQGRPIDIVMSPLGVYARTNPAVYVATWLGKVAEKTGKPYRLPLFSGKNWVEFAKEELDKNGLKDKETVYDPRAGRHIPEVTTGMIYAYKLQHTAESKSKARSTAGYTYDEEPSRGGATGSKHYGSMEYQALLSHWVPEVIRDLKLIKGRKNDEFWRQLKLGQTPAMPGTPMVYEKFRDYIRAAGVNITDTPHGEAIFAMTDKQARELTGNNKLENADTYSAGALRPIPGGLFDQDKTDSLGNGRRWAYYELPEPMLNPIMEEPIRNILGVTKKEFDDILAGRVPLDGKRGGTAVKDWLSRLDLDALSARARETLKTGTASKKNAALKQYSWVEAMKRAGVRPEEFMMTRVPVLPPKFRPIAPQGKRIMVADPNYLYKALHDTIRDLKDSETLPDELRADARMNVVKAYRSLVGVADPEQEKLVQKNVGGILDQLLGKGSPKFGFVQRRVIESNVDLSGLGVATLNPALKLNQIGMPESEAWKLYEPFVIRRLVRNGYPAAAALSYTKKKDPVAYKALQDEVKERPVLVNRAPTLHKLSIMAFEPVLTKGHTIQVAPAIVAPFNLDFDGDDQLNKVIFRLDFSRSGDIVTHVKKNIGVLFAEVTNMFTKTSIPVKDGHRAFVCDLQDFPRIAMTLEKEGAKGPIQAYSVPKGIEVVSYDETTGQLAWREVSQWSKHFDREVEIVSLLNGLQIITDDDPRAVYGIGSNTLVPARYTPTEALRNKVVVPVSRRLDIGGDETELDVSELLSDRPNSTSLHETLPLTFDFGYAVGAIAGDGWVSIWKDKPHALCICGADEDVLDSVHKSLQTLSPEPLRYTEIKQSAVTQPGRYGDCIKRTYTSGNLARVFLSLVGKKAQTKHLPACFLTASKEFRIGLFSGLMDTDGSIAISHGKSKSQLMCGFTTTSLRMAQEVCLLARSLGIRARLSSFRYRTSRAWQVTPSACDFRNWRENGMRCSRKLAKLNDPAVTVDETSSSAIRTNTVPFPAEIAMLVKNELPHLNRDDNLLYMAVWVSKKQNHMTRAAAEKLIASIGDGLNGNANWKAWKDIVARTDITWVAVASVEKTGIRETGYDLCVPGTETFMSVDGVVLSNTVSFTVPVSKEAVDEARRVMMPERNLLSPRTDSIAYMPAQELLMGLWLASKDPVKGQVRKFATPGDAEKAYRRGEIDIDTPVTIG